MRRIVLDFGWNRQYLFENQEDAFVVMEKLAQTVQFEKDGIGSGISEKTEVHWYTLDDDDIQDAIRLSLLAGGES
jgi:hypothetical protein